VTADGTGDAAVSYACGGNAAHAFSYATPEGAKGNTPHIVFVFGIDLGQDAHALLRDAPIAVVFLGSASCSSDECSEGTAILSWTAPSTNVDGSSLTDLAGYLVHYGQTSGAYSEVDVGMPSCQTDRAATECTHAISSLSCGLWCFAVSAYDDKVPRNKSPKSTEVSKVVR
jgi:hypothetical protein